MGSVYALCSPATSIVNLRHLSSVSRISSWTVYKLGLEAFTGYGSVYFCSFTAAAPGSPVRQITITEEGGAIPGRCSAG